MKKLLSAADACIAQMNWRDMALVKLCLCAAGVMLGLAAPKRVRKWVAFGAMAVFVTTYLPLMCRFMPSLAEELRKK
ncbi:permease of phosphate ABC transporter [Pseudoflavonifractor phocaeensis]|uniref:permease of phosphate ABC transporter n=1 Tax=Pseudoflavonifractor phocaeensis TaxID=1870988 RepID=UPI0019592DC1|nr:permease of phosphate ABC transporter [Pseudoflavonifractor phocaeensis]MBM6926281.1 permease of phosphate ABC transporter [Pseudoflavonifractor phocaeensis]